MSKLRKATKRITAVAASAAIVSSSVLAGGLSNYPTNFVKDDKFDGKIVIGDDAATIDSTAAESIIADLEKEFSGESEKVKITYKKSSEGGEEIDAVTDGQLNYGETLGAVSETSGFDSQDADVLEDGRFDNDISDEDYEQTLTVKNGAFNYALRDKVDGVDEIKDGIYYDNGVIFAEYTLEMDNSISLAGADYDEDLIGNDITIMGNEFTVVSVSKDGSDDIDKLVVVGGSNKISLGEGESTSVTVDGKEYEISVQNVDTEGSSNKVLVTINGQTKSVDEYDTEDIAGITIAVTDLVGSARDSVKGYAEIVIGGQKVTLEEGNIEVNDEELEDIYPDYDVDVAFSGTGLENIKITYAVDEETLLEKGDTLVDVLFDSFQLVYEGTNEPEYTDFTVSANKDSIDLMADSNVKLESGENFPESALSMYYTTEEVAGGDLYFGDSNVRFFMKNSASDFGPTDGVTYVAATGVLTFDVTDDDIQDYGFFYAKDLDDQYLYEVSDSGNNDKKVSFKDLIEGKNTDDVKIDFWDDDLEDGATYVTGNTSTSVTLDTDLMGNPIVSLDNGLLVDLTNAEDDALTTVSDAKIVLYLDSTNNIIDGDDAAEESDGVDIHISFPTDADDALDLKVTNSRGDIVNAASGLADNEDGNSDSQTFATKYGMLIEYDNDEYDKVVVKVPEEQVEAKVSLVFGGSVANEMTVLVDADMVEDKKSELEADGYTIVKEEAEEAEAVEFDVEAPVLASEVSTYEDMIVVGGPAVNAAARELLGIEEYTIDQAGVSEGEGVIRYFSDKNNVLVYGYAGADTVAAATKLNEGGLSGDSVNVQ